MAKQKGLGRGLDALLGGAMPGTGFERDGQLRSLPLEYLHSGKFQPRVEMDPDALEELTLSVRAQGVVQPIVVRADADGIHFEIIAGERRWRAAQAAGLAEIPAVVRTVDDETALAMSLIENIQREDLNPIEEAKSLQRLIEEFDMTHELAADAVGRSRAMVSNLLRLLDLHPNVRAMVERGEVGMGHARALLGLSGEGQLGAAKEVARHELSTRETEELVRRLKLGKTSTRPSARPDPDVSHLEQELSMRLGAPVRIHHTVKGKGSLTVRYSSLDELDGIIDHFK